MSFYTKVYNHSPVFMQNMLVSLYGYYWYKRRFGGVFQEQLQAFKERESFTWQDWLEYQQQALRRMLLHAYHQVPFYHESFTRAGFDENALSDLTLAELPGLPYLHKDDLRQHGTGSLLSRSREPHGAFYPSSGSTGTPTSILFSHAMHQRWSAAFEARIRHWAGVDKDTPRGMIGGRRVVPVGEARSPFYRYNSFEKQTYFSAYHISESTCSNYLDGMRKHQVTYMTGYAFSNYSLARMFLKKGLQPPAMRAVITSSEKLTDEMRQVLQEVYQCRVYDSYSGLEACGLISECEHGSLHISPDVGIMEIIKPDGSPAGPGEEGEVVSTGLLNFDQPLIRYRIGDRVKLAARQSCACGRQMPVVDEIIGRIEDVVVGPDGREMVRFHGIFIGIDGLRQAQVIQNSITDIHIRAVSDHGLTKQQQDTITERLRSQLGDIQVTIEQVDRIPPGPNGKFQAVISKINKS